MPSKDHEVKQGAVIGGWVCFLLASAIMYYSLWAFLFYGPLFFVAFILSIAAMAQRRILGGVLLLFATLLIPIVWLVMTSQRFKEFADAHAAKTEQVIPPEAIAENALAASEPTATPAAPVATSDENAAVPAADAAVPDDHSDQAPSETPGTAINGQNAPIIFETMSKSPTDRETIARFILGYTYRDLDEFARHDFLQKLDKAIATKISTAKPDDLYSISDTRPLPDYDFDKSAFPVEDYFHPQTMHGKPYIALNIPDVADGGNPPYYVSFENMESLKAVPVSVDEARNLAPALKKSRYATLTYSGTLSRVEEETTGGVPMPPVTTKILFLNVSQIDITVKESGQRVTYRPPMAAAVSVLKAQPVETRVAEAASPAAQVAGVPSAPVTPEGGSAPKEYKNQRFGFVLTYPSSLNAGSEVDDGSGCEFQTANREFNVIAIGRSISAKRSNYLQDCWTDELKTLGKAVTYKRKSDKWYVISGVGADGIEFYHKVFCDGLRSAAFRITYPHAKSEVYDPLVTEIAKAFIPFPPADTGSR